jgi:beta-glucosidase
VNQPSTYLVAPLGQASGVSNIDQTALFPFGHGLSYAPATWAGIEEPAARTWATDGTFQVTVTLRNDAPVPTSEVVQVYLHDPVAEVARPVQKLIAAPRVDLAPGAERIVTIGLHADLTAYTGRSGQRQVDPGEVELRIGASSADIRSTLRLKMTGARREVGFDRAMEPTVTVADGGYRADGVTDVTVLENGNVPAPRG